MYKTLCGSILSQNIENQQITSAKYTVLMLRVRQNERKRLAAVPRVIRAAKMCKVLLSIHYSFSCDAYLIILVDITTYMNDINSLNIR